MERTYVALKPKYLICWTARNVEILWCIRHFKKNMGVLNFFHCVYIKVIFNLQIFEIQKAVFRSGIDAVTETWKSPLVQQIKGLDIPKLAKNLVQRRISFSAAETWWQNTCI
jgi:hypothetical protein